MKKTTTKTNAIQTVRVIRMYKDKETGVIHKVGEVLELAEARARELMGYRPPFVAPTTETKPEPEPTSGEADPEPTSGEEG